MEHNKLYKKDLSGNIRVWWIEQDKEKYRQCSGVLDGKIVESGWRFGEPKNIGKVNETTPFQQASLEIEARYKNQLESGYFESLKDAEKNKPKFFKPMLAEKYKGNIQFPVFSQPKYDGVRCIASRSGLFSRTGKPLVSTPHIIIALQDFFDKNPDIDYIDGELYNHELKDDFDKIISLVRKTKPTGDDIEESSYKIKYYIYDVFSEDKTFHDRFYFNDTLASYTEKYWCLEFSETDKVINQNQLDELLGDYFERGFEGQIIRLDEKYENRRSKFLIKRKEMLDDEFEIVDIEEGVGNWAGRAKRVWIKIGKGVNQKAGLRGNFEFTKDLLENADKYIGTEVTVNYQNKTPEGKLRFPVAVKFWGKEGKL